MRSDSIYSTENAEFQKSVWNPIITFSRKKEIDMREDINETVSSEISSQQ